VIDGDKQFALIMMYVRELLEKTGVSVPHVIVNTAYTNGMANKYLQKSKVNCVCVPTGVKNAHPVVQQYVIGANDEPNGHGTIYVNWPAYKDLFSGKENDINVQKLTAFLRLSNIYVGDAISNLLMIEAILRDKGISID
jgi:phosphoacetylglucosamine mutase